MKESRHWIPTPCEAQQRPCGERKTKNSRSRSRSEFSFQPLSDLQTTPSQNMIWIGVLLVRLPKA
eukprot:1748841-Amphidinium_carterae.1